MFAQFLDCHLIITSDRPNKVYISWKLKASFVYFKNGKFNPLFVMLHETTSDTMKAFIVLWVALRLSDIVRHKKCSNLRLMPWFSNHKLNCPTMFNAATVRPKRSGPIILYNTSLTKQRRICNTPPTWIILVLIFLYWATGLHLFAKVWKSHRPNCGIHRWVVRCHTHSSMLCILWFWYSLKWQR